MPDQLRYSGARVPTGTEAHTVPADMARFGDDIDHLLVLKASSVADRNAKYGGANPVPPGTLVSGPGVIWRRNDQSFWDVVWSNDPPTSWTPQRLANNGEDTVLGTSGGSLVGHWSQSGKRVDFSVSFTFGGSGIGNGDPAGSTGYWLWTLPVPAGQFHWVQGTGRFFVSGYGSSMVAVRGQSTSRVFVQRTDMNEVIGRAQPWASGDFVYFSGSYWAA